MSCSAIMVIYSMVKSMLKVYITFDNLHWPEVKICLTKMYFTDFLTIKLELVNIHKYANQLICLFELYTNGQCCSFNLIPTLMFYDDQNLRYDQFTTYTPQRNVGHFVFGGHLEMAEFEVARIVFKCVRCYEDMVKISCLYHEVRYFLSIPLH